MASSTVQHAIPFVILIAVGILIAFFYIGYLEGRQQNEIAVQTAKLAANQSMENFKAIKTINGTLIGFINARNLAFNTTFAKLTDIGNQTNDVLKVQIANEKNIIGNLSDHRRIANMTRDIDTAKLDVLGNITIENNMMLKQLLNKTS